MKKKTINKKILKAVKQRIKEELADLPRGDWEQGYVAAFSSLAWVISDMEQGHGL